MVLVAGEASGDFLGAKLALALKREVPGIRLSGMGGQAMAGAGVEMVQRSEELALVGIVEVLPKLGLILRTLREMKRHLAQTRPDLLILIDFPDFNFRLGKAAAKLGIKVLYYVCPQVWAWRRKRAKDMAGFVNRLAAIFPFEEKFMSELAPELRSDFVGHPLLDQAEPHRSETDFWPLPDNCLPVGILPGSRHSEITRILPVMFEAARIMRQKRPELCFVLPLAPGLKTRALEPYLDKAPEGLTILPGKSRMVMEKTKVLLVASGTATLEAALVGTPFVVVYKTGWINYFLAKSLVKVEFIAMPNLVAGREVVRELIQAEATGENLAQEALKLLEPGRARQEMKEGLQEIRLSMGGPGASRATALIAKEMIEEYGD
ncbi:lipid-A-disaccharide synthase [Dethiosulfatarculus sandiegensis]|uniref:Lipid-A-disaccharide synthase n=1 Tax=Dethiosulfatarculus sandiegensis TaxID=1429043 RepID=A0A0D2GD63_9BACT|nr:lipid-A-disaccharide synthase [Dethiosulfatarculus sandiegensis]